jgi:hypothetical protein
LTTFSFEIIYRKNITFKFVTFEIRIFQMISDGETTKTKVVDLEKSYNFVADNIIIGIRLGSQILILKLN